MIDLLPLAFKCNSPEKCTLAMVAVVERIHSILGIGASEAVNSENSIDAENSEAVR